MKLALAPIIDHRSTILILGTMPGEESLRIQQYYGNRGNQFWKLLFTVFEEEFSLDYKIRLDLVHRKNIALWDVLESCDRTGSLDSNIKNEIANDFNLLRIQFPKIKYVCFSSKAAEKYYAKYCTRWENVTYLVLPSPSGANCSKSFTQKLVEWQLLLNL